MAPRRRTSSSSRKSRSERTVHGDDDSVAVIRRNPRVHTFTRLIGANDINKTLVDQGFGISFALSDLPAYQDFTQLFDQYRIDWVDYCFELVTPISNVVQIPCIYFAEDHDDTTVPSYNDMLQKEQCQLLMFNANKLQIKRRVVPNVTNTVYYNGIASGYTRMGPTWVDSGYPSVPHYGVKYFVQNYNTTTFASTVVRVALRYQISCKETL